jgi:curved DNA-binding protein CbpA
MATRDPYETLGVTPGASDAELRTAYRRLVKLHHPDHNSGSAESAHRFEAVQEAYARIRELREHPASSGAPRTERRVHTPPPPAGDPDVESRLEDLERQLREANAARERARQAAREAAAASTGARHASDEELGYVTTDDSFSKILADARDELFHRASEAKESPVGRRVADLIDEIDELASKLTGERRSRSGG